MNQIWYLECVNLFKIICPHKYKEYKDCHVLDKYSKHDYIYFHNDVSKAVYLVHSGKVKLGYYREDGTEIVKAILGKGEVFGENAFLGEDKRTEFAQAVDTKTVICPVPVPTLNELLKDNQSFSLHFYKLINFRIKKLERRLEILLFKDIKQRTIEFLLELKEDYGKPLLNGEVLIKHPYTQKEIACLIGASRPSLNIVLNELKELGAISFNRKEILIKNTNLLDT